MTAFPWHRLFHPLCGADPVTLAGLVARRGLPSLTGLPTFAVACACSVMRLPFTLAELALDAIAPTDVRTPVFIVGHPRSGTTHLHNLMEASGAFATAPPVLATLPWESRSIGPLLKPFVDPLLPETRLIDGVAMGGDAPTEDEVGLANLGPHSYFHAIYFPRYFARGYRDGLLAPSRDRAVRRYVAAMARRSAGRPLLLKNPAYPAQVASLFRLFPDARVVHIHRDPRAVFDSSRRALTRALTELSLQDWSDVDLDAAILETYPLMMRALREQTSGLPASRFVEVAFEDVVADPQAALEGIWQRLDLPNPPGAMTRVEAHLDTVRGFQAEGARLDPAARALVSKVWADEIALYARA